MTTNYIMLAAILILSIVTLMSVFGFFFRNWPPIFAFLIPVLICTTSLSPVNSKIEFISALSVRVGNEIIVQANNCQTLILTDIKFLEGETQIRKSSYFNVFGFELGPEYKAVKK